MAKDSTIDKDVATIGDFIEFLEKKFKNDQKLCFFDEGGAWIELVHIPKTLIGDWMFRRVKDKRKIELAKARDDHRKYILESYRLVNDDDVVIY